MKERLTDEKVAAIEAAPEGARIEVFDTVLPGLVLRVTDKGVKSFAIRYRLAGRTQRYTIGKTPPLKLRKAREIAFDLLAKSRQGVDPMAEKREARKAKTTSPPVEKVVERYIEKGLESAKPAHAAEVARLLRKEIAEPWKGQTLAKVEAGDVAKVLDGIQSPNTKRHTYFALRSLFKWAKGVGIIRFLPIDDDFPAPRKPNDRERVLEPEELKKIWNQVIGTYTTYNSILQLLIVTGQRRDEVAEAQWEEFDLDKRIWTIPASRTKAGLKSHRLPLSPLAIQILRNIPRTGSPFLFPGEGDKRETFSGWSRCKARLDDQCKVTDWRLHDIRRTVATMLAEMKTKPHVIERIIDHKNGEISGVAAIYNRASYEREMRDALNKWAKYVEDFTAETRWRILSRAEVASVMKARAATKESNVPLAAPKLSDGEWLTPTSAVERVTIPSKVHMNSFQVESREIASKR